MKILIINPPFYRLQGASLVHYPPGCCHVAAALEEAGYGSSIYNADFDPSVKTILGNTNHLNVRALTAQHDEYRRRLHDLSDPVWQEIRAKLRHARPDLLIISVFSTTLTAGRHIAAMAKEVDPSVRTVFEGCFNRGLHCAIDPGHDGDFSVMDFAIRREPEATVVELVHALHANAEDYAAILGLSWKKPDGAVVHNPERPFTKDLDRLPFPARHRLEGYRETPPHAFQGIYGSRGCPFDCVFCGCHTSMGYQARVRSAQSMVDEIELVYRRHGTHYFYLCDDIFFIRKDRAREFCHLLLERRLPVYWSAQTRAEMVDDETLALMRRAGGQHVAVGVEVGSPDIRSLIKKGNTVEDVRRCAQLVHRNGLYLVAFCMIGLPWERRQDIEATVRLVQEIRPFIVYPYLPSPAAGTELASLILSKNPAGLSAWSDRWHIDTSAPLSERMPPEEKQAVIEWALAEFVKINRRKLLVDLPRRPRFYAALASDMGLFRHPSLLWDYAREYLRRVA